VVGFVGVIGGVCATRFGERAQGFADAGEVVRERETVGKGEHTVEVFVERRSGLQGEGLRKNGGRDVGVAVAVSANPTANLKKGGKFEVGKMRPFGTQSVFDFGNEPG